MLSVTEFVLPKVASLDITGSLRPTRDIESLRLTYAVTYWMVLIKSCLVKGVVPFIQNNNLVYL